MIQFPPYPPGFDPGQYTPTLFDQIMSFVLLYMALLTLIGHCLPRPLFVKCFKTLFPFMPDHLEDFDDKHDH